MNKTISRDPYFDNAKFILIFLVVFGHMISPFKGDSDMLYALYNFMYSFHMPAFILIAGYFSKGCFQKGYLKKIMQKVLIPYFIFQFIYAVFYSIKKGEITFTLFDPYWTLWFLLSLVCWNLLLIGFARLKYFTAIFSAVTIGLIIGYIPEIGTFLSLSRTFVFFPIFLLGFYLSEKHFKELVEPKKRMIAAFCLVSLFLCYYFVFPASTKEWLLADSSYSEMGIQEGYAALMRLIVYGIVFLATFSFLAVVPRRELFFTRYGSRTMYIYLLHGFIVKLFRLTPFYESISKSNMYVLFFILAIFLCCILASKPVIKIFHPLIEGGKYLLIKRKTSYH
ncbi:acyltransferase family protein [Bacillus taeanensis]|nr:acyltransferase family protein [Bacillus taeanensis]